MKNKEGGQNTLNNFKKFLKMNIVPAVTCIVLIVSAAFVGFHIKPDNYNAAEELATQILSEREMIKSPNTGVGEPTSTNEQLKKEKAREIYTKTILMSFGVSCIVLIPLSGVELISKKLKDEEVR